MTNYTAIPRRHTHLRAAVERAERGARARQRQRERAYKAVNAALYVALISLLTQKQMMDSAPAAKASS